MLLPLLENQRSRNVNLSGSHTAVYLESHVIGVALFHKAINQGEMGIPYDDYVIYVLAVIYHLCCKEVVVPNWYMFPETCGQVSLARRKIRSHHRSRGLQVIYVMTLQ